MFFKRLFFYDEYFHENFDVENPISCQKLVKSLKIKNAPGISDLLSSSCDSLNGHISGFVQEVVAPSLQLARVEVTKEQAILGADMFKRWASFVIDRLMLEVQEKY